MFRKGGLRVTSRDHSEGNQVKTIADISKEINRHRSSISRVARKMGLKKTGRDYVLTEKQAAEVIATLRDRPGNPNFCE